MPTAERRISLRPLVAGLLVVALVLLGSATVPVAAQDVNIDGDYQAVNTVSETTTDPGACENPPRVGDSASAVIRVRRLGPGKVEFTLGPNLIVATISADLNIDAVSTASGAVDTYDGHFTVDADGTAHLEWTERVEGWCGGDGTVAYTLIADRRSAASMTPSPSASAVSATPTPTPASTTGATPSPSIPADLLGLAEADREVDAVCPPDDNVPDDDCEAAHREARRWYDNQRAALVAARQEAGPEFAQGLVRLRVVVGLVTQLQFLPIRCPGAASGAPAPARYPAIREANKYFEILWAQGLRATREGDLADLETTLVRADGLLALLIEMERRAPAGCP